MHVVWLIPFDTLDPARITSELGIQPSWAWAKGQRYLSRAFDVVTRTTIRKWYTHPWGIWAVQTKDAVQSAEVETHALFLLDMLEPRYDVIRHYLDQAEVHTIGFRVSWESNTGHGGFDVSSAVMGRMAALCSSFDFTYIHRPGLG